MTKQGSPSDLLSTKATNRTQSPTGPAARKTIMGISGSGPPRSGPQETYFARIVQRGGNPPARVLTIGLQVSHSILELLFLCGKVEKRPLERDRGRSKFCPLAPTPFEARTTWLQPLCRPSECQESGARRRLRTSEAMSGRVSFHRRRPILVRAWHL